MSRLLTLMSAHGFIVTSRPVAKLVGLDAAALLGELCGRQAQHGPDFWATNEQLCDSTTLSERSLRNASKKLVEAGFVSIEKKGLPAKNHYTVNEDAVAKFFCGDVERGDMITADCSDKSLHNDSDQSLQNATTTDCKTQRPYICSKNEEVITSSKNEEYIVRKQASAQRPAPSRPLNEEERESVERVVAALNEATGSRYRSTSATTLRHLLARLREGFTVEDCKEVIRKKSEEWGGTDMAKYLRPETLFGSKFEGYLNAPEDPKAKERAEKAKAEAEARKRLHEKYAKWDDEIEEW